MQVIHRCLWYVILLMSAFVLGYNWGHNPKNPKVNYSMNRINHNGDVELFRIPCGTIDPFEQRV